MLVMLSSVEDYTWYVYEGKRNKYYRDHNPKYELELSPREKFGIKIGKTAVTLMDADGLKFKLSHAETRLLLKASRPFAGKVMGEKVRPGTRRGSSAPRSSEAGVVVAPSIEDRKLTEMLKATKVKGIEGIKFIMSVEPIPGEVYHYYDATSIRNQFKGSLPKLPEFFDKTELLIEKKVPKSDVEIKIARWKGVPTPVMSVVYG